MVPSTPRALNGAVVLLAALAIPAVSSPAAAQVIAHVTSSQPSYAPGNTLRVGVRLTSPGVPELADVYIVLALPGGAQAVSLVPGGAPVFGTIANLQTLVPAVRSLNLAAAFSVPVDPFFTYTWTGSEPLGTYQVHMAAVRAGAFADGVIGAGELLAYASRSFTFGRPIIEVLQPGSRVESPVPAQGAQLTTTSEQGAAFTLAVPPGALTSTTTVAITPVTSIANLPLSGGLRAALKLEPDGTVLNQPATLSVTLPAGSDTSNLRAFLYSGTGQNFEVLPVQMNGNTATFQVTHFSTAGLASGTEADFIAQMAPLVAALPSTLPMSQVDSLLGLLVGWLGPNGAELCGPGSPASRAVCQSVYEKGLASLVLNLSTTCSQAQAAVDANDPFLAFSTLSTAMSLISRMVNLDDLAQLLNLTVITTAMPEVSCVGARLASIVPLAEAQGRARLTLVVQPADPFEPPTPLMDAAVMLLDRIEVNAGLFGLSTVSDAATGAIRRLMQELLPLAVPMCTTEVFRADALLFRPLQLFGTGKLDAMAAGLGTSYAIEAERCRVSVTPAAPTLPVGDTVQFTAELADPQGIPANFVWSVDSGCSGSISPSGLFTAGTGEQSCEVTAQVPPGGPLATRRLFRRIVQVQVANAVTITARTIFAAKSLRAGTRNTNFQAGPFTINQPRTEAFVVAESISQNPGDAIAGTASVARSQIVLDAPAAQRNRVITGSGNLSSSITGDAATGLVLNGGITADVQGDFDCTLQVTTSATGNPSSFSINLLRGATPVFNATSGGTQSGVCSAGTYQLTVSADATLVIGPVSTSRTFSFTLTLTPRASPFAAH